MYTSNLNRKDLILVNSSRNTFIINNTNYSCGLWQEQKYEDTIIKTPGYEIGDTRCELGIKDQLHEYGSYKVQPRTITAVVKFA